jgi:hypothetical protein
MSTHSFSQRRKKLGYRSRQNETNAKRKEGELGKERLKGTMLWFLMVLSILVLVSPLVGPQFLPCHEIISEYYSNALSHPF